jgi:adenosine deaminase
MIQRPRASLATDGDIVGVPKVELHVHLNGSISEATASALARRHGDDPSTALRLVDGRYPGLYPDFRGFLDAYLEAYQFVRTPDDLEQVASEFAVAQAAQNVAYSEAGFTAMIFVRNGMEPRAMWAALRRGLAAAPDTRVALIVDAIRDLGTQEMEATIRLVEQADAPIVGLSLTGEAGREPIAAFSGLRDAATRLGMGLEVHAGEHQPASSVVDALDVLQSDRIGHGVTAIDDPMLLARLVREGVPLAVCPSSNVAIGIFPSLEAHPFAAFWRAGVNMTISSDDPPFMNTTLTDELRQVVRIAGLTRNDLAELQRRGARTSFAAPDIKAQIIATIDAWVAAGDTSPRQ